MVDVAIEFWIDVGIEDVLHGAHLATTLGLKVLGIIKHNAVAIAQDVGREPSVHTQLTGKESWCKHGLHHGLSTLEILSRDGNLTLLSKLPHRRHINTKVGGTHHEGTSLAHGSVSITH